MSDHLFTGAIFFAWIILVMVAYSYHIVKLRWHLEEKYPKELAGLNFGKKMSKFCYYTTPSQAKNVMKFIHSPEHFNDPKIRHHKKRLRLIIKIAILWVAAYLIMILFLIPGEG